MSNTKPITQEALERLDAKYLESRRWADPADAGREFYYTYPAIRALIDHLETAVVEMYQYAGATGAPVEVLDNLSALSHFQPPPHEWKWTPPDHAAKIRQQATELRQRTATLEAANALIHRCQDRIDQQARYIELQKADTSWRSELSLTLQRTNEDLTRRIDQQAQRIAELEAQVAEYARALED